MSGNIFYPISYVKTFGSGTNEPILAIVVDSEGNKEDSVIKLMAGERMDSNAAMREYLAAVIANRMGLLCPKPMIIDIIDPYINSRFGQMDFQRTQQSKGLNFGSMNIPGLELFGPASVLHLNQLEKALKVFCFDLIIQNPDRTSVNGKPNLFSKGLDLWILDHELAFSFLVHLFGRELGPPWIIDENDREMIENHILFRHLKGKSLNFGVLDNFLECINDEFWNRTQERIPDSWINPELHKIKDHFDSLKPNFEIFIDQLKALLS